MLWKGETMINTLDTKYIEDKGNGTFRIRFRIPSSLSKKNNYFTKQIKNSTMEDAKAIRDAALDELRIKGQIDSNMKVKDCAELWLKQVVGNENEGTTIDDKISKLNNHFFPYLGNRKMCDVKRKDIQDLIQLLKEKDSLKHDSNGNIQKLSPTTINNVYNIVRAFFNWASDEDVSIIKTSPCRKISLPKREKYEKEIFEDMEIDKIIPLIEQLSIQTQCAFFIPLFCGLRRGEVAGLRWKDIDFDNKLIHVEKSLSISKAKGIMLKVTKTRKERVVCMNDLVLETLLQLRREQDLQKQLLGSHYKHSDMVFTDDFGDYITPNAIGNRWRRFCKKNKLQHVTYHGLRASYASLLSYSGIPLKEIQETLGHSEARTTTKYYTITYNDAPDRIYNVTNKFHK